MIFEAISIFAGFGLAITIGVPLAAMFVSFRAKLTGRYLNRYFIVSQKSNGSYELHHHPIFGFYYARERKLFLLAVDALHKFRKSYPDLKLTATSLTLQSRSRKGIVLQMNSHRLTGARLLTDFLILTNLANYRKSSGQWHFVKLIRFVHQNKVIRYDLLGSNGHEPH